MVQNIGDRIIAKYQSYPRMTEITQLCFLVNYELDHTLLFFFFFFLEDLVRFTFPLVNDWSTFALSVECGQSDCSFCRFLRFWLLFDGSVLFELFWITWVSVFSPACFLVIESKNSFSIRAILAFLPNIVNPWRAPLKNEIKLSHN